jgi:Uma2 family endonuclease
LKKDYNEKFNLYQENEVKEYWLANPEGKSIEIFHLDKSEFHKYDLLEDKEEIITSKLFPELEFKMTEIFEY